MNPLYNTNDSPNNSTQPTKSVNRQVVYVSRTHNTFDNSYFHYTTQKFGFYQPFFAMEGVAGDTIPLHSFHNVRSLPMSSPFLSDLKLNKDYFMVPMQSILPNTWEYIFKNPSQGDDVPDDANCLFPAFSLGGEYSFIADIFRNMGNPDLSLKSRLWWLLIAELFCSQGCLLSNLGYHLNPFIIDDDGFIHSFDDFFDSVVRNISRLAISIDGKRYIYVSGFDEFTSTIDEENVNLYQALSLLRSYGSRAVIEEILFSDPANIFVEGAFSVDSNSLPKFTYAEDFGTDINISRVLAYQLTCSQFYVNPQVDFLYNAQLYRDNLWTLMKIANPNISVGFFTMNGIQVPYDYASKYYMSRMINVLKQDDLSEDAIPFYFDYFNALFGHRESLRFGDYFTDSRTKPLALGDDSIDVSNDSNVSVIDVSKKIVYQRFRNAVVKLNNNFGDYLRGIFGTSPSPDYHFPKFISHQDFAIGGFEVANNTKDGQGDLVTNLNTRDDTFAFEVEVDMPCILLGISYFSVPRVYMQTKDRQFFHRDRYDMFNPMLQYIGDQIVYNHERTDLRPNDEIFGYQSRNNEYKQRYSVVSGAFATKLPAWTFVADSLFRPVDYVAVSNTQSPEFIRAHDYEFNRFFNALSGYSLANSFHFIVVYNNKCMSTRPMEINPNIL